MVAPGAPGYPKKVFIQIGLLGRLKLRELLGYVAFKFVAHTIEPVNIVGNRLEGNIPKELAKLKALKKLDLNRNPLGGVITPTVGGAERIGRAQPRMDHNCKYTSLRSCENRATARIALAAPSARGV